jgi:ATP-dependent Lon protease
MIKQVFKNGENEIRIENAESLDDAKSNNFPDGIYSRFFINNKPVQNYQALLRYIIDETQKSGRQFIPPSPEELKALQKQVLETRNSEIKKEYQKIYNEYKQQGVPEHILKEIEDNISKIDLAGIRVVQ